MKNRHQTFFFCFGFWKQKTVFKSVLKQVLFNFHLHPPFLWYLLGTWFLPPSLLLFLPLVCPVYTIDSLLRHYFHCSFNLFTLWKCRFQLFRTAIFFNKCKKSVFILLKNAYKIVLDEIWHTLYSVKLFWCLRKLILPGELIPNILLSIGDGWESGFVEFC